MTEKPEKYQHMLQNLVVKAQQVPLFFIMTCFKSILLVKLRFNINLTFDELHIVTLSFL